MNSWLYSAHRLGAQVGNNCQKFQCHPKSPGQPSDDNSRIQRRGGSAPHVYDAERDFGSGRVGVADGPWRARMRFALGHLDHALDAMTEYIGAEGAQDEKALKQRAALETVALEVRAARVG